MAFMVCPCCVRACCLETQCVIVYAVAWPDCPSPVPSIAGYSGPSAVTPCVFGYVGAEYTEVVDFQNCVDGDEWYFYGRFDQFFAAASAIDPTAVISGGGHTPSVPPFTQFTCTGSLTQAECLEQGGAFHAGKTCEEICCGACDEETPCPEGCACVDGVCGPVPCSAYECFTAIDAAESDCPEGCYCLGYDPVFTPEIPGACNANEFP